jgi:hypothetical protein
MVLRSFRCLFVYAGLGLGALACDGRANEVDASGTPAAPGSSSENASLPPATRTGTVRFSSLSSNLLADAFFEQRAPTARASGCALVPRREPSPGRTAGDVSITYTPAASKAGAQTVVLPWDTKTGSYGWQDSAAAPPRLDAPGTPVTFTGSGDEVPAFTATLLTADAVTVTGAVREPDRIGITLAGKAGQDLTLVWSPSDNAFAELYLGSEAALLSCRFPAPATTGTVPAALLAQALASPDFRGECPKGKTCLSGGFRTGRETTVRAAEWEIEAEALVVEPVELHVAP